MLLMIDNYDSFTYNLVQYFQELGEDVRVYRNDAIGIKEIEGLRPSKIVISPGPCTPNEAGISVSVIQEFAGKIPILGVCLGHQSIGQAFGGKIVRARKVMHGKTSMIHHDGKTIYNRIENPFEATRYHSLIIEKETLPSCLEVTAWTDEGEIMGIRHKDFVVVGIQFHPESILTTEGKRILENFLGICARASRDVAHLQTACAAGSGCGIEEQIRSLESRKSLSEGKMREAMREIVSGRVPDDDIVAFLTLLRDKKETLPELLGAARAMREVSLKINVNPENLVDTCGTGGDGRGTLNLSTAAAFVVAGAGVKVAKHGNRAVSSQAGSADVLEKLGVKIEMDAVQVRRCLVEAGFGFFFAPQFHPAMRNVAAARRKIGTRTIFNLLGPLTNPANPLRQVIGVYDRKKMSLMAHVLKELGSRHVLFVHGEDGLDEITLTARTKVVELNGGKIREWEINPKKLGLELCKPENLQGRDAEYNAMMLKGLLEGFESPLRTAVLLNAAAAFYVAGRATSLEEGLAIGEHSLDQGKAYEVLKDVIRISNE